MAKSRSSSHTAAGARAAQTHEATGSDVDKHLLAGSPASSRGAGRPASVSIRGEAGPSRLPEKICLKERVIDSCFSLNWNNHTWQTSVTAPGQGELAMSYSLPCAVIRGLRAWKERSLSIRLRKHPIGQGDATAYEWPVGLSQVTHSSAVTGLLHPHCPIWSHLPHVDTGHLKHGCCKCR